MKKILVMVFLCFMIFGYAVMPVVHADDGSSDSRDSGSVSTGSDTAGNGSTDTVSATDSSGSGNSDSSSENTETSSDSEGNETSSTGVSVVERDRVREFSQDGSRVRVERQVNVQDGTREVEITRKITDENGTVSEVKIKVKTEDGKREIEFEGEGRNITVNSDLELNDSFNGNNSDVSAVLSNGTNVPLRVLPDRALQVIRDRIRNVNVTNVSLREVSRDNVPRVVYNIEANQDGKFLGIFKIALKASAEVDSQTGEVVDVKVPWWAFLVSGLTGNSTSENITGNATNNS